MKHQGLIMSGNWRLFSLLGLYCLLLTRAFSAQTTKIDFDRQIRPLLSDRCFSCHGPDAQSRQANLRLDTADGLATVTIPHQSIDSELYRRIISDDPQLIMPHPSSKLELSADEIDVIRQWIDEGADYKKHWSFTPLEPVQIPSIGDDSWCTNPIDHFVLNQLKENGIAPNPSASKERIIRRLSFDLTGLPPTVPEIDQFLADDSPNDYESLVDRLLASPRFGERMASKWLDLARYADTYGYQSDVYRSMWPWRDWVIQAYNENLPYDQFLTWQLAGDLLPNATATQKLATAFNRHHRQTNEGGSVEEEFRVEYVADRTHTLGTTFLGLTIECARCHDHKYDPISQKDYYSLFAFFNNIDESGLYAHFTQSVPTPTLLLTDSEQETHLARLNQAVKESEKLIDNTRLSEQDDFENWKQNYQIQKEITPLGLIGHYTFDKITDNQASNIANIEKPAKLYDQPISVEGKIGLGLKMSGENSLIFEDVGDFRRSDPFTISLWLQTPKVMERAVVFHRSRSWTDAGSRGYQLLIEDGRLSASLIHFWPGNAIRIRTEEKIPTQEWLQVVVSYDGSSRANGLRIYLNGELVNTGVVRDNLYKNITGGGDVHLTIGQRFRDRGFKDGLVDEFKVFNRELSKLEIQNLYGVWSIPAEKDLLEYYLVSHSQKYQKVLAELRAKRRSYNQMIDGITEIMTMRELDERRPTYILKRGLYDAPTELVRPDTPKSILPFPTELPRNRLGLAKWLTNPQNPLTARVAVNRYWQILFGQGLVQTAEDFGIQGQRPDFPGLLDWMANDFIHNNWNQKDMIKKIVMSSTYQQSSVPKESDSLIDPDNFRLSRGPRHRLSAEMIRDSALSISGLLVDKIGGPSVKPYQPDGLWKEKSGRTYETDKDDGLYRRSLYTYWKRTSPPPSMMIFDAAKRDVCVAQRQLTNTPTQALVLLNDTQFVEAARFLAQRMLSYGAKLSDQLKFGFRLCTGRIPTKDELQIVTNLYFQQKAIFQADKQSAIDLLSAGNQSKDPSLPPVSTAATCVVASMLLNFDETISKR